MEGRKEDDKKDRRKQVMDICTVVLIKVSGETNI